MLSTMPTRRGWRISCLLDDPLSPKMPRSLTWMPAGPRMIGEQHRQEEQDHRHGELRRQRGGLLLGRVHAHVAAFAGQHAQRVRDRRAVALGLDQRLRDRLDRFEAGAAGKVLVGLLALLQDRRARHWSGRAPRRARPTARRSRRPPCGRPPRPTCPIPRRSASGRAHPARPSGSTACAWWRGC